MLYDSDVHSISLSYQGPTRKPKLIEQRITIFTNLNDLNAEKNPSPAVTWTPSNVQSRHKPRELHTNQDGIFLCILLYLNISDFSWLGFDDWQFISQTYSHCQYYWISVRSTCNITCKMKETTRVQLGKFCQLILISILLHQIFLNDNYGIMGFLYHPS